MSAYAATRSLAAYKQQSILTATLAAARAEAARELTALRDGRGAVAGYAAARTPETRRWVDGTA